MSAFLLPADWQAQLTQVINTPDYRQMLLFLQQEYQRRVVYPPAEQVFRVFQAVPFAQVRVVILGQDPYLHFGEAEGFAFSVSKNRKIPSSLHNIHRALAADLGLAMPPHGSLAAWLCQGVFLLNTILTVAGPGLEEVRQGAAATAVAGSHRGIGWESVTDAVIKSLSARPQPLVFMLWGKEAQSKRALIDTNRHRVLEAPHPSGLSAWRGFLGCRHFSQANLFLQSNGLPPVDWNLPA
ncbi:MAG: uracil-DNA glycosylase [Negativicutes bacterium]|nr:uracil-DNA glycosylase [Negativicutes bacterium]